MKTSLRTVLLLASVFAAPVVAFAQPRYGIRSIDRPLTLPGATLRVGVDGSYRYERTFQDGASAPPFQRMRITPSLDYGVWDNLMVGGELFPATFWPDGAIGDPSARIRYRIQLGHHAVGIGGRVRFPFSEGSEWRINAEIPVQLRLSDRVQFATGATAVFSLQGDLLEQVGIPFSVNWQFSQDAIVRFVTGVSINGDFESETVRIPFELQTAYTFSSALGPVAELGLFVGLPDFLRPAADDPLDLGVFEAGISFNAFFYQ